ncbi:hypothetical protein C7974DRAFT_138856 [Boeremia exigua]|uniref:uncharacterized protein n=1 Tax=Boeremia exigua TaxID=749465 RepID=UPI001E8DAECB|nr:uncharacterized protein C7974DRAFT_138856 [Boeremia exigua]KAH6639784.1 hypothetical protein C7974DRAFT_138856 [Boeremia exigua]
MRQHQTSTRRKLALGPALRGKTVVVIVGPEQKRYCLHQDALAHSSDFFRNAFSGPWKEAEDGVLALADVEVETFDLFAHWIYAGTLPKLTVSMLEGTEPEGVPRNVFTIVLGYVKAIVFGDKYLARAFGCAVQEVLQFSWTPEWTEVVRYAYANLPPRHPFLQQLADEYRMEWCIVEKNRNRQCISHRVQSARDMLSISVQRSLPTEFLLRVNMGILQVGLDKGKTALRRSTHCYSEHDSDEDKRACGKPHVGFSEETGYGFYE